MNYMEIYANIQEAQPKNDYMNLKSGIFGSPGIDVLEEVATALYHNWELAQDVMNRSKKSIRDLNREARQIREAFPASYRDLSEWGHSIWLVLEDWTCELLSQDSRICKRAGWWHKGIAPEPKSEKQLERESWARVAEMGGEWWK